MTDSKNAFSFSTLKTQSILSPHKSQQTPIKEVGGDSLMRPAQSPVSDSESSNILDPLASVSAVASLRAAGAAAVAVTQAERNQRNEEEGLKGEGDVLNSSLVGGTSRLVEALRNETDTLKNQLASVAARETVLRTQLENATRAFREGTATLQAELANGHASATAGLLKRLSEANARADAAEAALVARSVENTVDGLSQVFDGGMDAREMSLLERDEDAAATIDRILERCSHIQGLLLPPRYAGGVTGIGEGGRGLDGIEAALERIRGLVEARLESMKLVKSQLQANAVSLQDDLSKALSVQMLSDAALEQAEANAAGEVTRLRADLEATREAASRNASAAAEETEALRGALREAEERARVAGISADEARRELTELQARLSEAERENGEHEEARMDLTHALRAVEQREAALVEEIAELKLVQKFGVTEAEGGLAGLKPSERELMVMVDQLLDEVEELRARNAALKTDVIEAQRTLSSERLAVRVTANDVARVAVGGMMGSGGGRGNGGGSVLSGGSVVDDDDDAAEAELTAKLYRASLHSRANQRPGSSGGGGGGHGGGERFGSSPGVPLQYTLPSE